MVQIFICSFWCYL